MNRIGIPLAVTLSLLFFGRQIFAMEERLEDTVEQLQVEQQDNELHEAEVREEIEMAREETEGLQDLTAALRRQIDSLQSRIQRYENIARTEARRLQQVEKQALATRQTAENLMAQRKRLENKVVRLKASVQEMERIVRAQKNVIASEQRRLGEASRLFSQLRAERRQLESELKRRKIQAKRLRQANARWDQKLDRENQNLQRARARLN